MGHTVNAGVIQSTCVDANLWFLAYYSVFDINANKVPIENDECYIGPILGATVLHQRKEPGQRDTTTNNGRHSPNTGIFLCC